MTELLQWAVFAGSGIALFVFGLVWAWKVERPRAAKPNPEPEPTRPTDQMIHT